MRILVVEDEPVAARFAQECLRDIADTDAVPSLALAREHIAVRKYDAVVADLQIRDSQGPAIVETLRGWADLPIVILTGAFGEDLAVECIQRGAQEYLIKDKISATSLPRVMRYAIERHRRERAERELAMLPAIREEAERTIETVRECRLGLHEINKLFSRSSDVWEGRTHSRRALGEIP